MPTNYLKKQALILTVRYCIPSNLFRIIVFLLVTTILLGCQKGLLNTNEPQTDAISSSAAINQTQTAINEIPFSATALIAYCHGENITFSGLIKNLVATTTDGQGVIHYSRHFGVRGMSGVGSVTGTVYDVIGGAEMFSVKDAVLNSNGTLNLSGSLSESDIVIHEGTLVFVSRTDDSWVIARHIIQKSPNIGIKENHWVCANKR